MTPMITEINTSTSTRSGNRATTTHSSSLSRRNRTGHLTLILSLAVIMLAMAWGLYESVQVLTTGVIPRY
jgi:hypothetical protein